MEWEEKTMKSVWQRQGTFGQSGGMHTHAFGAGPAVIIEETPEEYPSDGEEVAKDAGKKVDPVKKREDEEWKGFRTRVTTKTAFMRMTRRV
jgi:hypothetical protein